MFLRFTPAQHTLRTKVQAELANSLVPNGRAIIKEPTFAGIGVEVPDRAAFLVNLLDRYKRATLILASVVDLGELGFFHFNRENVTAHERLRSDNQAAFRSCKRARATSPEIPSPESSWARPREIFAWDRFPGSLEASLPRHPMRSSWNPFTIAELLVLIPMKNDGLVLRSANRALWPPRQSKCHFEEWVCQQPKAGL
jgi:hypothetical protein